MSDILPNEKEYILRAKKDPEAFGAVYDGYYRRIFRFIFHKTSDIDTAKDLTSETFFQALKSLWRFRFTAKPFSAWLYKIASRQVAMHYRREAQRKNFSLEENFELYQYIQSKNVSLYGIEKNIDSKLEHDELVRQIKKLKDVEQNVIILRYFEEKSLQEISDMLGMKLNTVKSHLRRGLQRLKNYLGSEPVFYGKNERRIPSD